MSKTVFISYSHDSPEQVDAMLELSDRLRAWGIDCGIDQYEQSPPGGWAQWSMRQLEQADVVLVVCTENYLQRYMGEAPEGEGQGVKWEGAIITQQLYGAEGQTGKFVPIVRQESDREFVPLPLKGLQTFMPFSDEGFEDLVRLLTDQPRVEKPELGTTPPLPPRERTPEFPLRTEHSEGRAEVDDVQSGEPPRQEANLSGSDRVVASQTSDDQRQDDEEEVATHRPPHLTIAIAALVIIGLAVMGWYILRPRPCPDLQDPSLPYRSNYFKNLPSSLLNTIQNKDFLFWVRLHVRNTTAEPIHIVVSCQVVNTPKPAQCQETTEFTVQPGESVIRLINPRLRFIVDDAFDKPLPISIRWRVLNKKGTILHTDTHEIRVAPKSRFYWELDNSWCESVDKEFLIASLSAWTITSQLSPVFLEGKQLADDAPSMTQFIESVYSDILTNEQRLSVHPGVPELPPDIFEDFKTPKSVLASRTANPVEAVLLIGALSQSAIQKFQCRLVGVSSHPGPDGRRPILAVWSEPGGEWKAIDLTKTQLGFDDNLAWAQTVLDQWFDAPEVMSQLKRTGVYFDLDMRQTAIEFDRAATVHQIQGLP